MYYVTVQECTSSVYVPNSFTPNEDGVNDVWQPSVYNTLSYEVFVFDRWGNELFYSNEPNAVWIGNVDSEAHVQNESYTWMIIYETPRKGSKAFVGNRDRTALMLDQIRALQSHVVGQFQKGLSLVLCKFHLDVNSPTIVR